MICCFAKITCSVHCPTPFFARIYANNFAIKSEVCEQNSKRGRYTGTHLGVSLYIFLFPCTQINDSTFIGTGVTGVRFDSTRGSSNSTTIAHVIHT